TTRDTIEVPFVRQDRNGDGERNYVLIDTAGIRRRGKVHETIEKFSVIKALQAVDAAQVVMVVIDARDGITDQDLHLLGYVLETGR
ncbi:MAG TPA: ribosome biogenesis GTPase Der, partial [Alcanivorax sp.]|nr:ribosome biogenesis GTPase Der [Alcanivorax sp.]